jgi:hypothetical protein
MTSSRHTLRNEKNRWGDDVAHSGKFKPACDRIVAASRYDFNSAAAVITRKLDGGYVVKNPPLSSNDCGDCYWTEDELAQVEAHANGQEPLSPQAPGIGHNGPPSDPGPDRTYGIGFRVPEYVPRDKVNAFERFLQEQGAYGARLAALDQAAYRVRASSTVTARAYRVYDAILDVSRGGHRCSLWTRTESPT